MDAYSAKTILLEGNKRFVNNTRRNVDLSAQRENTFENGQKPFATIIACSDSRVSPEILFDTGIGELFVIRTAGNVLDDISKGTVQYAVEHLKTPLVVVLAHESCGAVTATCKSNGSEKGPIASIIEKIKPSAKTADNNIELASELNAKEVKKEILSDPTLSKFISENNIEVITMKYYLSSGEVKEI